MSQDMSKNELRKLFQDKRKARFEEIKAKVLAQREQRLESKNLIEKPLKSLGSKRDVVPTKKPRLPPIKQTKTSKLRLDKNNPLHGYDLAAMNELMKSENRSEIVFGGASFNANISRSATKDTFKTYPTTGSIPKNNNRTAKNSQTIINVTNRTTPKPMVNPKTNKTKLMARRSISLIHLKKQSLSEAQKCIKQTGILKARSEENVSHTNVVTIPSPIPEEFPRSVSRKTVAFLTPKKQQRTSCSFYTPLNRTPAPAELRERLIKWLEKRGKSLNSYEHLRCFGVHQTTPYRQSFRRLLCEPDSIDQHDENKENIDDLSIIPSTSDYVPQVVDYTNFTTNEDIFGTPSRKTLSNQQENQLAQNALNDVYALIMEHYPQDQCEAWLSALKRKYPSLQDLPEYWECKAALGVENGEFPDAIDCYQEAIIKGAAVSKVDQCIENLLEKFSVLNLSSSLKAKDAAEKKKRSKILLDARNVFKSSVIKFAVQQRDSRKKTEQMVKPVRRSTRLSRSAYVSTPKQQLYDSLGQVSSPERRTLTFRSNPALANHS